MRVVSVGRLFPRRTRGSPSKRSRSSGGTAQRNCTVSGTVPPARARAARGEKLARPPRRPALGEGAGTSGRSPRYLLATSVADNVQVAVLEALSRGIPTVSTRVGDAPTYYVSAPLQNLCVPTQNPEAMAAALADIASSYDRCRREFTANAGDSSRSAHGRGRRPSTTSALGQLTSPAQERDPAARGSALLFWAQLAGNSGLFVALVLITRALGPSGRGTIAFITVAAILLARIARVGVSEATTVFTAQRPEARPALLTNLVLSAGTSTAIGATLVCGALAALPASMRPSGIGTEELVLLGLGALASAFADAALHLPARLQPLPPARAHDGGHSLALRRFRDRHRRNGRADHRFGRARLDRGPGI